MSYLDHLSLYVSLCKEKVNFLVSVSAHCTCYMLHFDRTGKTTLPLILCFIAFYGSAQNTELPYIQCSTLLHCFMIVDVLQFLFYESGCTTFSILWKWMYYIATFLNPCCSTCWISFIPADCNVPLLLSHFDSSLKFGFYHLSWAFLLEVYLERGYRELGDCLVRMWPGLPRFQVFIFAGDQRSQCTSDPLLALRRNRKLTYDGFRDFVQPLQK